MEFFEKAHVQKKDSSKNSKSEEIVKKQLKQMLHGYKRSDNELIRNTGNAENDIIEIHRSFDDSTSVSGFSDLNLTFSDVEDDLSQESISKSFTERVSSSSDVTMSNIIDLNSEKSDNTESQESSTKLDPILEASTEDIEEESISEYCDDIDSLSEVGSSNTSADVSLLEFAGSSTEIDDTDSEPFDQDGSLASKILENLSKSEILINKQTQKRKLNDKSKKNKPNSDLNNKPNLRNKKKNKTPRKTMIEIESLKISSSSDEEEIIEETVRNNTEDSVSTTESTPYISITASEMNDQSLNEIFGQYTHPTVRNLPCEKQNITPSLNFGILASESIDTQDDDVDSLIPELGDDMIIEDLDVDLENTEVEPNDESTDVYDNTVQSESSIERELSTDEEYASPMQVYYLDNSCIFVLRHPAQLYVNGKVKVQPLGGTIEVFGYILKEEVDIFAPNNSFAHCLKTVEHPNVYYGLFGKLTSSGLSVCEAEEIVTTISEHDCVIRMSPLVDVKMDFVETNVSVDLFTKPCKDLDENLEMASSKLACSLFLKRPWRYFEENECWLEAVKCGLNKYSRGIVCGGKGLGKSTFVRYYVNQMLNKGPVLVIDLDPGQSEFTVAGCISATVVTAPLLGPNFTHLKTPDISLNIGMINIMDHTLRYARAITDLISHCRSNEAFLRMPWIINTMGMTTQMGLKFLLLTIIQAQPTFLLQIDTTVAKKRFEVHLQRESIIQLYENFKHEDLFRDMVIAEDLDYTFVLTNHVAGSNKHNTAQSPKVERYFNFVAYFAKLLDIHRNKSLLAIVPYEVNLADLNVLTNVKVAQESILKVLNGKIVALCQLGSSDKGNVFTLDDKAPLCHGHGLVRGVDFEKSVLYIVSPVAADRLARVDTLVYADWAPELRGEDAHFPAGTPIPYRSATHHRHKQLMLSPRRRFNPLQLLKMSRSA